HLRGRRHWAWRLTGAVVAPLRSVLAGEPRRSPRRRAWPPDREGHRRRARRQAVGREQARPRESILRRSASDALVRTNCRRVQTGGADSGYERRRHTAQRRREVAPFEGAVCPRRQEAPLATAVCSSVTRRRLAFQYNPMPTRFNPTTTLEILTANQSQLL